MSGSDSRIHGALRINPAAAASGSESVSEADLQHQLHQRNMVILRRLLAASPGTPQVSPNPSAPALRLIPLTLNRLNILPASSPLQATSPSPFVDPLLFSYDAKSVGPLIR